MESGFMFCLVLVWLYSSVVREAFARRLEAESSNCPAVLLEHFPKVALLFLVRGPLPHERLWTQWLSNLSYMTTANVQCNQTAWDCYKRAVIPEERTLSVYDQQQYFSIYVHTKPDFPGYPPGSIFHGRVVGNLHKTAWGSITLVAATLELVRAALQDPHNQRFQLLCEATIPVRPAEFTHQQLMAEQRSCIPWLQKHEGPTDIKEYAYRFPLPAHEEFPALKDHMRTHAQFFMLTREHAELVCEDNKLFRVFHRHCNPSHGRHAPACIPDEQYFGTLLSYKLQSHARLIDEVRSQPVLYLLKDVDGIDPEHINLDFLMEARGTVPKERAVSLERAEVRDGIPYGRCQASERPAISMWEDRIPDNLRADRCADQEWTYTFAATEYEVYENCPLFIRKFKARTNETVYRLLHDMHII